MYWKGGIQMDNFKWPFPDRRGKLWNAGSGLTLAAVASVGKLVLGECSVLFRKYYIKYILQYM